jgi:prolyl 4-hydroxylase|tara:strand:+ start:1435 stop:1995 length:561 start_codon:yes stop_codon:yes gene_type:complete
VLKDFISTWTIPEHICDEIINFYNKNAELHFRGVSNYGSESTNAKVSTDLMIDSCNKDRPFGEYHQALQKCLDIYIEEYPDVNNLYRFGIIEPINIQHYKKGEGFKALHCERHGHFNSSLKRCLVFMTYLNDLDAGGTIFKHQNRTIKAQKGKTVIWPSDWTHTHVGQISQTQEKTIITGWYSYLW